MADLELNFDNCNVSIEKMFDIHDNQSVNVYSNTPKEKPASSRRGKGKQTNGNEEITDKQHGVDYPVFSKGLHVTTDHIKAIYRLLTSQGWISTQTKEPDFQQLFSGKSNNCEIIWTGQDKLGNNDPTILGKAALYVLFKSMHNENLITTSNNEKVGPILESHFVGAEGHFLTSMSNNNKISGKANNVIQKALTIMRTTPNSEDIQRWLKDEMQEKVEKNGR